MKLGHYFLPFLLLNSLTVNAATVSTSWFSLEVPDGWTIEDNKTSIVLAMGGKMAGTQPMPFLSIQYCSAGEPAANSHQRRCEEPCSEKSLASLGESFQAVVTRAKPNGVVEYSTETTIPNKAMGFVALQCSASAQAFITFASDEPGPISKALFSTILGSLKWKQPQTPR